MNKKLKLWELGRIDNEGFKKQAKFPIILVLDNIRSLNNVGSFFRTADALNVEKIYLCGITACPPHREIQKTALGATDTVDWEYASSALELQEKLKQEGFLTYAIEQTETTCLLHQFEMPPKSNVALIFGNEVDGVQQALIDGCQQVIEIPQFGTKHSFNVSVSAGIVVWEMVRQLLIK